MNTTLWAEPGMLILVSLAEGAKHGYAIQQDIAAEAGVTLGAGTLYGAIARLESRGLIRGLDGDGRRRPYELTPDGATELTSRLANMRKITAVGTLRLSGMNS